MAEDEHHVRESRRDQYALLKQFSPPAKRARAARYGRVRLQLADVLSMMRLDDSRNDADQQQLADA